MLKRTGARGRGFVLPAGIRWLAASLVFVLVACSTPTAVAPTAPAAQPQAAASPSAAGGKTVHLGASNAGATNAPFYVADDLGYFADQGITLDQVFFPSASEVIPALTKGDVDAAIVGVNPATLNALAGNFGLHVVADAGSQAPGFPANVLVAAKEVASSIKGPADLRGKKVALTPPGAGTASGYMLSKYLAQASLTLNDVDLVALNFPDQVAALTNHSVDAAMMTEPFATRTIQTGSGGLLATGDQMAPGQQVVIMVYTDRFVTTQRDDGVRLMTAYLRGLRAYLAAFSTGDQRDRIIQILTSRTDIKDPQLWMSIYPTGANPDGTVNVQSIMDSQSYFQGLGLVQNPADLNKVVDTSFTQAAVQALGPGPTPAPPKHA